MFAHRVSRLGLALLVASLGGLSGCQSKDTTGISDMMIGAVCTSDNDCIADSPLQCETQGRFIDGQCTMFCGEDSHCVEEFGERALCIVSANRCVRKCVKKSDCPVYTYCNKEGYCVR